jgi:FixJ family two-component response regulator
MTKVNQVVFVIDDDPSMRGAMKRLLEAVGYRVETYGTGQDFLKSELPDAPACVVLDVRLPESSGLELQREMASKGINIPVIFVTGHGDIPMSVQAMKAGAVEFLTKPFRDQDLLDAISQAIKRDRAARRQWADLAELRNHLDTLTRRELEVMVMVVAGMLNKQIASELGLSEKTIKVHRSNVMHKMQAGSLPALVRMADKLGLNNSPKV